MRVPTMPRPVRLLALLAAFVAMRPCDAQTIAVNAPAPEPRGRIQGTLFDSLLMRPVARATVMLMGTGRADTSDARGRFSFDTVAAGTHEVGFSSTGLDSAGLGVMGAAVGVTPNQSARIALASPSLSTLWKNRCRATNNFFSDSTIAWGTVRDAVTDSLLRGVTVAFSWYDLRPGKQPGLLVDAINGQTVTDANGNYFACGLPKDIKVSIQALSQRAASGRVEYAVGDRRLHYVELTVSADMIIPDSVPLLTRSDSLDADRLRGRAQLRGLVVNDKGKPLANAIVMVADLDSAARTGEDGRFTMTLLPGGTQTLSVRRVGSSPVARVVQLRPDATTDVEITLSDIATLAAVNVRSSRGLGADRQSFEQRKRVGFGYFLDGNSLASRADLYTALRIFPGLMLSRERGGLSAKMPGRGLAGGQCSPNAFLDGVLTDFYIASSAPIEHYRAVEMFASASQTPAEYYRFGEACGTVLFWTRNARW